jgi:DNA/RNA-binding domain of Phe-tRNA-synthetase-like protein
MTTRPTEETSVVFTYDDRIIDEFPTIRAAAVHATGLGNPPSSQRLLDAYRAEQAAVSARLGDGPIAELPSVAAWRRTFSRFGTKPTQYRNAAEALLRRLMKQGDIPSIGTLVDIGNLASIRYAMPVAVIDLAGIDGGITVRFADGHERFTDLGSTDPVPPDPGEVVFVDGSGAVAARRWCWRQSAQSGTGPTTTEALVVVEGHHEAAADEVEAAGADLLELLAAHQPDSSATVRLLSPEHPTTGPSSEPADRR